MATNAITPTRTRAARAIHWLFPSRWQVAIVLAADFGLTTLGLPIWMHVVLSLALHVAVHLVGRRS